MSDTSLRPYQETLVGRVRDAFGAGTRRVLMVSPTGSGKTRMFAHIAERAAAKGNSVLILAHRTEICDQISGALPMWHGRIQPGGLRTHHPVQVGMVQTVARSLAMLKRPSMIILDEAHHAVAGTWAKIMAEWPDVPVLGVTATPARLDGRGMGDVFGAMVVGPAVADLIEAGYLSGFRYLAPPHTLDLSAVRTTAGDYNRADAAKLVDKPFITGDAVAHYQRHLAGAQAIAFCITVEHARHVADAFQQAGIRAASVDGGMTPAARAQAMGGLRDGGLTVLTSCELISEGVDVPAVAGAILLRPTASLAMFLQQVGRVLRPKAGGAQAIILDHVGNYARHGLPDTPREWTLDAKPKRKRDAAPPHRQCKACGMVVMVNQIIPACQEKPQPAECLLNAVAVSRDLEVVNGQLIEVNQSVAWANRHDLVTTPVPVLKMLARTEAHFRQIAAAKGYHWRWALHAMEERNQKLLERSGV